MQDAVSECRRRLGALPRRLSRSVIDSVDPASAEFAPNEYASTERVEAIILCARFWRWGRLRILSGSAFWDGRPSPRAVPADSGRASGLGSRSRFGGPQRSWSSAPHRPALPAVSSDG
jgi:hypothetical protein